MKRAILLLTLIAAPILLSPACSPPEFLKGNQREVTVHLMRCEKDLQYGAMFRRRGCEGSYIPAQVFHYKLFLNEQIVVSKAIPTAWKNCGIYDEDNWYCKYRDGSDFGMDFGKFHAPWMEASGPWGKKHVHVSRLRHTSWRFIYFLRRLQK